LLPEQAMMAVAPGLEFVEMALGQTLVEPGTEVDFAYFPLHSSIVALVLPMRDGHIVEAATIGREGVIGGTVSLGQRPAFARSVARVPGQIARISIGRLETIKRSTPILHDILARYADCLTAQVLQSVGCATLHPVEARCARWLLMTQDRLRRVDLPLTQEALADMFGVARTYVTRIANTLQDRGAISYRRGIIRIERRAVLEEATCECYWQVRRHFERILPGLYPTNGTIAP
jgi:CRP-like cAMP-binding protein